MGASGGYSAFRRHACMADGVAAVRAGQLELFDDVFRQAGLFKNFDTSSRTNDPNSWPALRQPGLRRKGIGIGDQNRVIALDIQPRLANQRPCQIGVERLPVGVGVIAGQRRL